jgi:hypothetical protein
MLFTKSKDQTIEMQKNQINALKIVALYEPFSNHTFYVLSLMRYAVITLQL